MHKNRIFSDDYELLICGYYKENNISVEETGKKFNCSRSTVLRALSRNNIKPRNKWVNSRKYNFDENYFSNIDSKDKAYFLGLIVADGSVRNRKLDISLQEEDGYILKIFQSKIGHNGKMTRIIKQGNYKLILYLQIYSKIIFKDLKNLGVIKKKSHFTYFPDIPEELYSHFIRGLFDGDGSIGIYNKKNSPTLSFSIIGNDVLIKRVQDILIEKCLLNITKFCYFKNTTKNIVSVVYSGNKQVKRIYNWLYKDCEDLFLKRKKEKFELGFNNK